MKNIDYLAWLQNWYLSQCNGDWEHEFGIDIKTVDNPGWYVTINLTETQYANCYFEKVEFNSNENNWYFCVKRNNNFEGSGGPHNLIDIIRTFKNWIETCQN